MMTQQFTGLVPFWGRRDYLCTTETTIYVSPRSVTSVSLNYYGDTVIHLRRKDDIVIVREPIERVVSRLTGGEYR